MEDIALPGEADWEMESHMIGNTMKASCHSSLSSSSPPSPPSPPFPSSFYVQIPPTIPEKNGCFRFGLALIRVSPY